MRDIIFFLSGLALLVVGSNLFVDTAVRIAKRLRVPELVVGATLVSIGTTLPEVMFSATAAFHGHGDMALGNALGSILCNTALIAGMAQAIRPSPIDNAFRAGTRRFFLFAALYCGVALLCHRLPRWSGWLLLLGFCYYTFAMLRERPAGPPARREQAAPGAALRDILLLLLEGAFLYAGAHLLVQSGPVLARALGVPERVVSLSLIALGTSLPELMTGVIALIKGHGALSLGNIVGANTLNLLLVSGVAASIMPLYLPDAVLRVELPLMVGVMALLCVPALIAGRMQRWQGFALLAAYAGYLAYLF